MSDKCYLLFLVIFKSTVYYLLKWIKFLVKKASIKKLLENGERVKDIGKVGEFYQSGKVGTMIYNFLMSVMFF